MTSVLFMFSSVGWGGSFACGIHSLPPFVRKSCRDSYAFLFPPPCSPCPKTGHFRLNTNEHYDFKLGLDIPPSQAP
ncbi:hypothetical protein BKA67DRAFT_552530 [Truncatella angustata]|uniref:Secreted protein n=1 Tax=Truncatella angustata TaxID=152316 RepID=A0A9P8UR03_9PEZI|nr:uncharacterized protein BKA67DRAFT_552530 [Truncatella angustata]KAH6656634.1 hypothetical protein BKA67DRAFT_552530 [Truncatella angustata]